MSATKKDIAKVFSDKTSIHPALSMKMVNQLFDAITEVLSANHRIEVRNFGVFEAKKKLPRKALNPKTGERIFTLGGYRVHFKAGKEMIGKVAESFVSQTTNQ